jgi:uncharacterized membrane protein
MNVPRPLSWRRRFTLREYARGSLWIGPLLGGLLGSVAAFADIWVDRGITLPQIWQYSPSTASTVLATIVGALVGLTGFVITVTVLVVQMATGTFSARYMRLWYRDRMLKALLAVLVATIVFSLTLLRRVESDFVPNLGVTLAGTLVVVGLLLFLIFLDRVLHRLRPVAVTALAAHMAMQTLREPTEGLGRATGRATQPADAPRAFTIPSGAPGAIQAIDRIGLVRWAVVHDCHLRLPYGVGDFVESHEELVEVFGQLRPSPRYERELTDMVALGIERTIEQDAGFAVRVMVDVAIRALSPAVNDPTTAVQVLNHLGELLRVIGASDLAAQGELRDDRGALRVLLPVRSWEEYLALGVTEIRVYGANSIQVVRRLRAMLDGLLETVRPEHRAAVEDELARLDATVEQEFSASVDVDRAGLADRQGIGGSTNGRRARLPVRVP